MSYKFLNLLNYYQVSFQMLLILSLFAFVSGSIIFDSVGRNESHLV